ncbi:hypothetical protein Plhal710r2_c007g0032391 [Plasmopara halstedii]
MRVYVFVAIFVRGVSFCFAVRLGERNCDGLDTNNRDPLCTPPYKAYTIPDGALRHNVALLKNKDRVDDKENEARGTEILKKFQPMLKSQLSGDKMSEIHSFLRRNSDKNTADVEIVKIIEEWFLQVKNHFESYHGSVIFDVNQALQNLMTKMNSRKSEFPIFQVTVLLENYRVRPEFQFVAENLERLITSNTVYKHFVFIAWIKNNNTLRNALRILVGDETNIDFDSSQFRLWLEYSVLIKRFDVMYTKPDNVPSSIFSSLDSLSDEVKSMHYQPETFTKILQEGEAALAHLVHTRRVRYLEGCLSKAVPPEQALKEVKDHQQAASDDIELILLLNYVIRYRINHDYPDTKLYNLLTSEHCATCLIKQQKPQHLAIWILATCRLRDKYRILTPAI